MAHADDEQILKTWQTWPERCTGADLMAGAVVSAAAATEPAADGLAWKGKPVQNGQIASIDDEVPDVEVAPYTATGIDDVSDHD
jgi:hypothetical protein